MAHFYGRLQGSRGEATRVGGKASGIRATVETWTSVVSVAQFNTDAGDRANIVIRGKQSGMTIFHAEVNADMAVIAFRENDVAVGDALVKVREAFAELDIAVSAFDARRAQAAA